MKGCKGRCHELKDWFESHLFRFNSRTRTHTVEGLSAATHVAHLTSRHDDERGSYNFNGLDDRFEPNYMYQYETRHVCLIPSMRSLSTQSQDLVYDGTPINLCPSASSFPMWKH